MSPIKYFAFKRPLLLFEALQVKELVKPGLFLELEYPDKKLLENIELLSKEFKLRLTLKNGGYMTKSALLYKEWNEGENPLTESHKFLGYPECCVNVFKRTVTTGLPVRELYTYYLIMTLKPEELRTYLRRISWINYFPCSVNCELTKKLSRKNRMVFINNQKLFMNNFRNSLYGRRVKSLIKRIERLIELLSNNSLSNPEKIYNDFRNNRLIRLLNVNDDFKQVITELLKLTPEQAKEQINNKLKQVIKNLREETISKVNEN